MEEFNKLQFGAHPMGMGKQASVAYDNGYGASVVIGRHFYSNGYSTYELAVMESEAGVVQRLTYETPVTNDVLGHLTPNEVDAALKQIAALPKRA